MSDPRRVVRGKVRTKDLKPYKEGGYIQPHAIVVHPAEGKSGSVPVSLLRHHPDGVGPVEKWMVRWLDDRIEPGDFRWVPERFRLEDPSNEHPFIIADRDMDAEIAAALQAILGGDHE